MESAQNGAYLKSSLECCPNRLMGTQTQGSGLSTNLPRAQRQRPFGGLSSRHSSLRAKFDRHGDFSSAKSTRRVPHLQAS